MQYGGREETEGKRAEESAFEDGGLTLPKRPALTTESSREVSIRYRGQALACDVIREPRNAAALARKVIRDDSKEHFVALYLDGRHKSIGHSVVSIGTATASLVHPREVFQAAILLGAVALVVAHNHPSGDIHPSAEDYEVTKRLAEAGKVLGVRLIDSLVLGRDGFHYSLREERPQDFP